MQENSSKSWVNGKQQTEISIHDRAVMYGQSIFETIAVYHQKALLLDAHIERLQKGCKALSIDIEIDKLISEINHSLQYTDEKSILRVSITMGEGGRGYKNPDVPKVKRIISLHDYPEYLTSNYKDGIEIGIAEIRLANQPELAGIKHSNRLEQIIARSQWQPHWQEALLLDANDRVIEGTQSNIFIVSGDVIKTPDLSLSGVAGVMRNFILSTAQEIGVRCEIVPLSISDIEQANEVFLSNSIIGLWPVRQLHQAHNKTQYSNFKVAQQLLTIMQDHGAIPNI